MRLRCGARRTRTKVQVLDVSPLNHKNITCMFILSALTCNTCNNRHCTAKLILKFQHRHSARNRAEHRKHMLELFKASHNFFHVYINVP